MSDPALNRRHDVKPEFRRMTNADFDAGWPRFSKRLSAALKRESRGLLQQGVRLQLAESVCRQGEAGTVLNAAVALVRHGLRESSVAGLHVTHLRERENKHDLANLAHQLTAAATAWLQHEPPLGVLPVFTYP
jgi:hypothetical protein